MFSDNVNSFLFILSTFHLCFIASDFSATLDLLWYMRFNYRQSDK